MFRFDLGVQYFKNVAVLSDIKPRMWMPDVKWRWDTSGTEKDKKLRDKTIGLVNYMAIEFTQHDGRD